jgi:hypothetical protein
MVRRRWRRERGSQEDSKSDLCSPTMVYREIFLWGTPCGLGEKMFHGRKKQTSLRKKKDDEGEK